MKVEMNKGLLESLVNKYHVTTRVFPFGLVELCLTIEEFSRILGVPCKQNSSSLLRSIKDSNCEHPKPLKSKGVF